MVIDHGPIRQRICFGVVAWSAGWLAALLTAAAILARLTGLTHMSWAAVLSVGAAAWLIAIMQTTLSYAASHNAFAPAAKARIVAAGVVAGTQLLLLVVLALLPDAPGAGDAGMTALLAGQLLGLCAGLLAARRLLRLPAMGGWRAWPRRLVRRGIGALLPSGAGRRYLVTHRAFWHFSLPSALLNAGVGQLPLLIIGARHGAMAAGLFALTQRVLAAPISLLAASVLEVFKRESVRQYQSAGDCRPAYLHALRVLVVLGIGPSLLLLLASPALFAFAFGESWRGAGELAQILAPLFFLNFVASPLSYVFSVAGQQRVELLWQIALFLVTLGAFAAPVTLTQSVLAYTIGYSLLYLLYLQMSYRYAVDRVRMRRLHVPG